MKCPKCGSDDDKVLDSRSVRDGAAIRRRRECIVCGSRFTTHEEIDRDEVTVVKQDGTREPFSRQKLEKGVRIACQKRPVSEDQLQSLLDSVVASLEALTLSRLRPCEHAEEIGEIKSVAQIHFGSGRYRMVCSR